MAQTTDIKEGAMSHDNVTNINANFTDLYGNRTITVGDSATVLSASGISTVGSSAASTFTLTAPTAGVSKYLECIGATANVTVNTGSTGVTIGTTFHNVVFTAADQAIHLVGESATKWIRISQSATAITTTT